MATLQFTVYNSAAEVALGDPIQEGVVTIGASSAQSAACAHLLRRQILCDLGRQSDGARRWHRRPAVAGGEL